VHYSQVVIAVRTLSDGGQSALELAHEVAEFLDGARTSLDLAQYDFHLAPETAAIVGGAITRAAKRGVAVRVLYNVDHRNPIPVPPPSEPDTRLIASLDVPARAIAGVPDLMHHKFVVRDQAAIWTGSANWTDDSWSRQENLVVRVESDGVAACFAEDFEQLWRTGAVEQSGFVNPAPVQVGKTAVRSWFTPGNGEALSSRMARALAKARQRVRICSPVITAAPVLATLAQRVSEGSLDIAGCVDQPQLQGVILQWRENGNAAWKLPLLERALTAPFSGKRSNPWKPEGGVHDFMHAKVTVADDVVFAGSFNLSRSGELNAENVLELHDAELADRLAGYIDEVRSLYPPFAVDER